MKTVVITGVSRGIGKAVAERFLANGYYVIGTSTDGKADLKHENFIILSLDLTSSTSIEACTEEIIKLGKRIDILVNNAGIWDERDDQLSVDVTSLRNTLEVNLLGTVNFTERLASLINSGGHIVNITSRRGSFSSDIVRYPAYSISKAALNMYTKVLAERFKGSVTVSCIHPGSVQTDMNPDGQISPEEAAEDIFKLATSSPETGKFWFQGEIFPW